MTKPKGPSQPKPKVFMSFPNLFADLDRAYTPELYEKDGEMTDEENARDEAARTHNATKYGSKIDFKAGWIARADWQAKRDAMNKVETSSLLVSDSSAEVEHYKAVSERFKKAYEIAWRERNDIEDKLTEAQVEIRQLKSLLAYKT